MAYVKTISPAIKSDAHLSKAVDYITSPQKTKHISYSLCVSSSPANIAKEFELTRIAYNKNDKILAHHLVQSFSQDDNITPELAHKIGQDFIDKCLSKYQVVCATHIDGKCIHNHFIINSVSPFDGKKFEGNKKTIRLMRRVSDELCYKNNLSVIELSSNYKTVDRATRHLAMRGESWKFNLIKDIHKALENCKTKKDFIKFFIDNDYEIKYKSNYISFKKAGAERAIRTGRLAEEFGGRYAKASIDKKLNVLSETTNADKKAKTKVTTPLPDLKYINAIAEEEWKRYEKKYKNTITIGNKKFFSSSVFSKNPFIFTVRLINHIFSLSNKHPIHTRTKEKKYKIKSFTNQKNLKKTIYNVPYSDLVNTVGACAEIKLYSWQLSKLFANNILCSANIDLTTGTAIVTIKQHDIKKVTEALSLSDEALLEKQSETIRNRKIYRKLKKENTKIEYLIVSKAQVEELEYRCVEFAKFEKGEDKFNIAFSPKDKDKILKILYPNKTTAAKGVDSFRAKNIQINNRLKKQSKETGEKLCYRIVVSSQFKLLKESDIDFAVFRQKDGRYNIVFLEHDEDNIIKILKKGATNNVDSSQNLQPQNPKHSI